MIVIRPDGYVAFVGPVDAFDELGTWVRALVCR